MGLSRSDLELLMESFEASEWTEMVLSINGTRVFSNSGATAYACSKAAQVALVKMTALEFARYQVRVNAICPGTLETPMTAELLQDPERRQRVMAQHPLGRLGTAEDIVNLAVYLASDESSWVTGAIFPVDGGRTAA